jgi:hypothetical protein
VERLECGRRVQPELVAKQRAGLPIDAKRVGLSSRPVKAVVAAVDALAERAIPAMARAAWEEAEVLVERARSAIREAGLDDYVATILLDAVAARVAIHRGEVPRA